MRNHWESPPLFRNIRERNPNLFESAAFTLSNLLSGKHSGVRDCLTTKPVLRCVGRKVACRISSSPGFLSRACLSRSFFPHRVGHAIKITLRVSNYNTPVGKGSNHRPVGGIDAHDHITVAGKILRERRVIRTQCSATCPQDDHGIHRLLR